MIKTKSNNKAMNSWRGYKQNFSNKMTTRVRRFISTFGVADLVADKNYGVMMMMMVMIKSSTHCKI